VIYKTRINIPIFPARFSLIVGDAKIPQIVADSKWFGDYDPNDAGEAITVVRGGDVGVIFQVKKLSHNFIAHEVFHATMAVYRGVGDEHTKKGEEAYAYLNGWLTKWTYTQIKKWKLEVK